MRKFRNYILGALTAACLCAGSNALAQPTVRVEVDQNTVALDETFTMTVEIRGGSALTTPEIPPLGNFDVVGRSTANSVEIVNGEMSVSKTFTYVLSPRRVGEFQIGPVKVYIEGQEYSAGPVRVRVTLDGGGGGPGYQTQPSFPQMPGFPSAPPGFPQLPGMPQPWPRQPPQAPPDEKAYADTFVTAETDRKEAYVGQQVIFTFRLYSTVSISGATLSLPDFKDFFTEELMKERKYETELGGRRYADGLAAHAALEVWPEPLPGHVTAPFLEAWTSPGLGVP